jgi:hypothetical protein
LSDKCIGPYEIIEKVGTSSWKLNIPRTHKIYPVFNKSLLTLYHEPPSHRRDERPTPDIINDEPEYEVEAIVRNRKIGKGFQYKVKWKGYPNSENTWEP